MLKQKLSHKLLQKLSPQQIQLMKLLQVPTASLEQRIKEELDLNPALEESNDEDLEENPYEVDQEANNTSEETPEKTEDAAAEEPEPEPEPEEYDPMEDIDISDYLTDDDIGSYKLRDGNYSPDSEDDNKTIPIAVHHTFHEHLMEQLGMVKISERDHKIAIQLVGSIDDDGYLRRELEAIVDDLAFAQNIDTDEVELLRVLKILQKFEPAGVGSRTLRECLILQIQHKEKLYGSNKYLEIAEEVLENYFEEFAKKHYEKLLRQLSITNDDLKGAIDEILKLNPKPGGSFVNSLKPENYIIPDFIITNENGKLHLRLNSKNAPDLRISDSYRDMLKDYSKNKSRNKHQREAVMFIKQKIDSAKWFIDAIKQRQQTMLKTMQSILDYQYQYLLTGDEVRIKPMILKDIAEITGLDISTVSRVSNSKYVQTEFGTFKLKSFFSESLQTDSGDQVSTREVKKILSNFINNENKRKPLSDQKLTESLVKMGYNIARRTVAKYREQMNIPVARLRKQL